ncbi:MAG TPA: isoamylase early set domain-containing protein [Gemmatimonadales bacterium]|nr:isoamylase early set domain-containing protein [Gemmatimonadales bacterium]
MKNHGWNDQIKQVLDGERELESLPPELRHEAEAARRQLLEAIDRRPVTLSDDVEARVMARVRSRATARWPRAWRWLSAPTIPRWAMLVPLAAAAALVLFVRTTQVPQTNGQAQAVVGQRESVYVRFELYAPRASRVALAGSFNRWNPAATPLVRVGPDGMWTVTLALPAGQHQYGFIVDGRNWVPDPAAPTVDDGFGRRNSVVSVNTINGRIL